jgi:adenine-specific DNA-methyltransferase
VIRPGDSAELRKERGAFFTPPAIADYLADWAVGGDPLAKVLDPTCGEAIFLLAAGRRLKALGREAGDLDNQLFGVDLHESSLNFAQRLLEQEGLDAHLVASDFFDLNTPDQLGGSLPMVDAVIGNPPFIRYQLHAGETRARSRQAALRQGVRISGLASSWASLVPHSCGFLKPEGRLAMVLPAELLTVGYAEPIRTWLRERFEQVHLVLFDRLQFNDATEKIVLVLAKGSGGCDAFSLYYLDDAKDLTSIRPMENLSVTPASSGKWTDLLLPNRQRLLFKQASSEHFVPLERYGSPELGTVTGANSYFTLTDETRLRYGLLEHEHVRRISPPGTKHFKGLNFTEGQWKTLRDDGERVWMLFPNADNVSHELRNYLKVGIADGVPKAYKCSVRTPWWRPPAVSPPDLFFTYMSHRYPRLIANTAKVTFVNSMHGLRLRPDAPKVSRQALPLLAFNSLTMLGAELYGRSYGGGVLKMEPREAAVLPVPSWSALEESWSLLEKDRRSLDNQLQQGKWTNVVKLVDEALLVKTLHLSRSEVSDIHDAARNLRARRIGRENLDAV